MPNWNDFFRKSSKDPREKLTVRMKIIDQLPIAVIVTDLRGMVEFWNLAAEKMYGFSQVEALGQHISFLYLQDDYDKFFSQVLPGVVQSGTYEMTIRNRTKSGELVAIRLTVSRYKNIDEEAIGLICCCSRMTDDVMNRSGEMNF